MIAAILILFAANNFGLMLVSPPLLRRLNKPTNARRRPGQMFWRYSSQERFISFLWALAESAAPEELVSRYIPFKLLPDWSFVFLSSLIFTMIHVLSQSKTSLRSRMLNSICWMTSGISFAILFQTEYIKTGDLGWAILVTTIFHCLGNLYVRAWMEFKDLYMIYEVY